MSSEETVSYVNAPLFAEERGLVVRLVTDSESPDHRNLVTLRGTLADGSQVSVSGTLVGIHQRPRLGVGNGYEVDLEPAGHLVFVTYADRPGMVGTLGGILGDFGINIAGMQVAREDRGGPASHRAAARLPARQRRAGADRHAHGCLDGALHRTMSAVAMPSVARGVSASRRSGRLRRR